jgi:hypothetical protein
MDNHHHRRKPGCTHETSTSKPPLKNLPGRWGKTVSYTILVAETKKNSEEESDVLEFSSLAELKKLRTLPRNNALHLFHALSSGVDKQFRHIHAEADHFKQFVRLIERAGIDI